MPRRKVWLCLFPGIRRRPDRAWPSVLRRVVSRAGCHDSRFPRPGNDVAPAGENVATFRAVAVDPSNRPGTEKESKGIFELGETRKSSLGGQARMAIRQYRPSELAESLCALWLAVKARTSLEDGERVAGAGRLGQADDPDLYHYPFFHLSNCGLNTMQKLTALPLPLRDGNFSRRFL